MSADRKHIEMLEMEEYLLAATAARAYAKPGEEEALTMHLRGLLRWHRFFVFNWLLLNGETLPCELLRDQLHTEPGQQHPDKPTGPRR